MFAQILAHEDGINCVKFADTSSQILLSAADDGLCKVNADYNSLMASQRYEVRFYIKPCERVYNISHIGKWAEFLFFFSFAHHCSYSWGCDWLGGGKECCVEEENF